MTMLRPRGTTSSSPLRRAAARFFSSPGGVIGVSILLILLVLAVFADLLAPHDPLESFRGFELAPPSSQFPLGTDHIGRDQLSRIIYGTRVSLLVGLVAVGVGAGLGATSGMLAGFVGGSVDHGIMRVWDAAFSIPPVLFGIALAAVLGPSPTTVGIAIGIASMPIFARIGRAAVVSELGKNYVEAARSMGARPSRIFLVHLLPNTVGQLLVQIALAMAFAVLLESALSFLGLGVQPPEPSWGVMLAESRRFMSQAWWYAVFPGLVITALVLALNLVADGLRDTWDPESGGR